ncbi:MAG: O-antigen ligase family protein [Bdellovibrionota bacterium]
MRQLRFNPRNFALLVIALVFTVPHIWSAQFYQGYYYPKKCFIAFIIALAAFALAFEKRLLLPEKRILILSGILLILKVIATLLNLNWVTFFNLTDAVALGVLCIYFMTAWQNHKLALTDLYWIFAISGFVICAVSIQQFINARILIGQGNPLFFSGHFGNINMMTEYLILLTPLGLYLLKETHGWRGYIIQFIMTFWIFFILAGQSRTTWLGLAFCFGYGLFKKLKKKEWATFALAAALFVATWFIPNHGQDYAEAKRVSVIGRMEIYRGAINMLLDNPLGVGGGEFEYSYLPYQLGTTHTPRELVRYESPHSEPMKWGIENGWAFLLVNSSWWFVLMFLVWRIPGSPSAQTFYRTSFAVMIPQVLFQFPFDDPASYVVIALMLGLIFLAIKGAEYPFKKSLKVFVVIAALFFTGRAVTETANKWIDSQLNKDKEATRLGCEIDPTNWRVCFYHEMILIQSDYAADAVPIAKWQLRQRPFQFHNLRILGIHQFMTGDIQKACETAHVYDSLFKGNSYFTPILAEKCIGATPPFKFENSSQFNRDYRNWLSTQL